jgi:hypothetical protein
MKGTQIMNVQTEATKTDDRETRIQAARDSFSGRTLTDSQFKEAWALSRVLQGEIQKTGSFREKLTDYAHAYGRSEKFDALRGETILRDIYTARYGQSMNQTREGLLAAAENLPANAKTLALNAAESIGEQIQQAPTQPFYMAYDNAAVALATELKPARRLRRPITAQSARLRLPRAKPNSCKPAARASPGVSATIDRVYLKKYLPSLCF